LLLRFYYRSRELRRRFRDCALASGWLTMGDGDKG
jgi:hypothetical protein